MIRGQPIVLTQNERVQDDGGGHQPALPGRRSAARRSGWRSARLCKLWLQRPFVGWGCWQRSAHHCKLAGGVEEEPLVAQRREHANGLGLGAWFGRWGAIEEDEAEGNPESDGGDEVDVLPAEMLVREADQLSK